MNKTVVGGIVGIIVLGAVAIFIINMQSDSNSEVAGPDTQNSITRPAVQAIPNTFNIMTPEEKAAADEAAKIAAEEAARAELASSTASSSEEDASEEKEEDTE